MKKKLPLTVRLLDLVEAGGKMSSREITEGLGIHLEYGREVIRLHRVNPEPIDPRRLRVCDYRWPASIRGSREKVYEISDEPDVEPPQVKGDTPDERIHHAAQIDTEIAQTLVALRRHCGNPFAVALAYAGVQ